MLYTNVDHRVDKRHRAEIERKAALVNEAAASDRDQRRPRVSFFSRLRDVLAADVEALTARTPEDGKFA